MQQNNPDDKTINSGAYNILLQMRDKDLIENLSSKLCHQYYLPQTIVSMLNDVLCGVKANDAGKFHLVATKPSVKLYMNNGNGSGAQKVTLGNNYDFGCWSVVMGLGLGLFAGYLIFSSKETVL